jgi:hypothetical protein
MIDAVTAGACCSTPREWFVFFAFKKFDYISIRPIPEKAPKSPELDRPMSGKGVETRLYLTVVKVSMY